MLAPSREAASCGGETIDGINETRPSPSGHYDFYGGGVGPYQENVTPHERFNLDNPYAI